MQCTPAQTLPGRERVPRMLLLAPPCPGCFEDCLALLAWGLTGSLTRIVRNQPQQHATSCARDAPQHTACNSNGVEQGNCELPEGRCRLVAARCLHSPSKKTPLASFLPVPTPHCNATPITKKVSSYETLQTNPCHREIHSMDHKNEMRASAQPSWHHSQSRP